ncbi:VTT domain-containing protein [Bacillus sp. EB600]|uniref:VTT domain-containing protein n=1 Tax=Bacillus sp. EB600 TaxID=2806345 RepID=UPI00210D26EB|nr:VTT domain-containing protein [Bacillus sp. EB600]MCQ6282220.1 VTT domain-containing protein [Bacillus sp. EB600]
MSYLLSLFAQHSYLILFIGIFLELMALPISGEVLMSYAGYFVYQGKMNYILALFTVFLSAGAGITVTYWIGKAGGYKLIEKYGKYIHLGPERYNKIAAWFERSGSKLLIFAYFIPGVRHFTGYVSGISRIPFRKFIIPAYTGAFLWGICFITLGKVLGPEWKAFHQAASKYLVLFLIVLAVLLAGFLVYRFYKNQIKDFFIRLLQRLSSRLKTIRATEIFLISLTLVLIGMVSLMLGMAQDYLYSEFTQFNQITEYMVHSVVYMGWMQGFLVFQQPFAFGSIVVLTIIRIWIKGRNRVLEYLLLIVSIFGAIPFRASIMEVFSFLRKFGFVEKFHSSNFPDLNAIIIVVIYGTCLFLLVRHSDKIYLTIVVPLIGLVILMGLAIVNITLTNVLPSDLVGGYVYGGVWIFFNFLLFEMFRLVLEKY